MSQSWNNTYKFAVGNPDNNYYNFLSAPLVCEERIKVVKGMILEEMLKADRGERDPIYIAWDGYNVWYRARVEDSMRGTRALEYDFIDTTLS